jgi:hypothetical protein
MTQNFNLKRYVRIGQAKIGIIKSLREYEAVLPIFPMVKSRCQTHFVGIVNANITPAIVAWIQNDA